MNNKNIFFIVGAQRSGTTYLYSILDKHPEICMAKPVRPEPKYFLDKNSRDSFDHITYLNKYYTEALDTTKCYGEKSTSYYENKSVAEYLSKNIPHAKIIFILADPVFRAVSNYKFSCDHGLETRTLKEVFIDKKEIDISKISTSVNPFTYCERGEYYKYLDYYYQNFPKENIKVLVKEKFINNLELIQELYTFLDVDNTFIPDSLNSVVNKSETKIDKQEFELVCNSLSQYYSEYNKILSEKYDIDISLWR